jgi:hypothetical protein
VPGCARRAPSERLRDESGSTRHRRRTLGCSTTTSYPRSRPAEPRAALRFCAGPHHRESGEDGTGTIGPRAPGDRRG